MENFSSGENFPLLISCRVLGQRLRILGVSAGGATGFLLTVNAAVDAGVPTTQGHSRYALEIQSVCLGTMHRKAANFTKPALWHYALYKTTCGRLVMSQHRPHFLSKIASLD